MPKGSPKLTAARKEEIIAACEKLYQSMSFKEITIQEIAISVFQTVSRGNWPRRTPLRQKRALQSSFPFRDITICFSVRRNGKWLPSARRTTSP